MTPRARPSTVRRARRRRAAIRTARSPRPTGSAIRRTHREAAITAIRLSRRGARDPNAHHAPRRFGSGSSPAPQTAPRIVLRRGPHSGRPARGGVSGGGGSGPRCWAAVICPLPAVLGYQLIVAGGIKYTGLRAAWTGFVGGLDGSWRSPHRWSAALRPVSYAPQGHSRRLSSLFRAPKGW